MRSRRARTALLAAIALTLAACADRGGPPGRPEGIYGGRLELFLDREPVSLDPAFATDVASAQVLPALFDGLTRLGPDGRPLPQLAERWTVADGGRTYRFTLREGVRFHNGQALTAEDVVFSFRRLLDPETGSPRAWVLADLAGAQAFRAGLTSDVHGLRALDARTVELVLARPSGTLLSRLAMPAASILDGETLGGLAGEFAPVGTGPFRLASWRPGEQIALEAFLDHFAGRPYLDAVVWRLDLDRAAALRAFAEGRLGALELSPGDLARLREELRWDGRVVRAARPSVYYLALNNARRPLADPLIRQALNHAIDRQALLEAVVPGGYVLANGSIPPGVPGHDPDRPGYEYDPLKARQLLAQAGVGEGLTLTAVQPGSSFAQAVHTRVAEMLERVGVRLRILTVDQATFDRMAGQPDADVDLFLISWWADYPDPENFLLPLFHSAAAGAGGNRARFASPEIDRALEELAAAVDPRLRAELARQVEDQVFARAPWVPLFFPVRQLALQPGLRGLESSGPPHAESLWDVWWEPPVREGGQGSGPPSS